MLVEGPGSTSEVDAEAISGEEEAISEIGEALMTRSAADSDQSLSSGIETNGGIDVYIIHNISSNALRFLVRTWTFYRWP